MEEMAVDETEAMPTMAKAAVGGKKKRKGFFSKMNDAVSSNVHQASRFNAKSLAKKM